VETEDLETPRNAGCSSNGKEGDGVIRRC